MNVVIYCKRGMWIAMFLPRHIGHCVRLTRESLIKEIEENY